jgi:hypothetical protein
MKTRSAKNKGKRLQKEVQKLLLEATHKFGLVDGDIQNTIMGESGRDIKLSPAAEKIIPFDIECKNQENIQIWSAIQQAQDNTKEGRIPLLVFRKNNTKAYAVIEFDKLIKLLYEN